MQIVLVYVHIRVIRIHRHNTRGRHDFALAAIEGKQVEEAAGMLRTAFRLLGTTTLITIITMYYYINYHYYYVLLH
jgi:hypothetical protein